MASDVPPVSRSAPPTTETYGGTPYVLAKDGQGWTAKIEVPKLSCVCYGATKRAVRESARRTIDWILLEKL